MRKEVINNIDIEFYNSIREIPEWKWQLFQSIVLQVDYIGSTLEDVSRHFQKFDAFLSKGKYDELLEERINLTFNFNAIINKISIKTKAMVCFIKSIGGVEPDLSNEDGLEEAYQKMLATNISTGQIDDLLGQIKKKLMTS